MPKRIRRVQKTKTGEVFIQNGLRRNTNHGTVLYIWIPALRMNSTKTVDFFNGGINNTRLPRVFILHLNLPIFLTL
uniref:Uncharacterized protein n=1 Tax=Picea glauca TaxID=3330 RepID=A0A101M1M2_PICGL|nr:hypothetical protein ABT39_MTgene3818 [Picea glauca]QHR90824.1 hypothetical protein Q903MT_gene4850 [Picea sitchensis]